MSSSFPRDHGNYEQPPDRNPQDYAVLADDLLEAGVEDPVGADKVAEVVLYGDVVPLVLTAYCKDR